MATKTVRFTGARTGQKAVSVYPYGVINVGDTVELDADEAERWTTLHSSSEAGTAEDLEGAWTVDQLRVIALDHGLDDKGRKQELAERIHAFDPNIAPSKQLSDFEEAAGEDPTVTPFSDKGVAPEPDAGDNNEDAEGDPAAASEGVTDVG